MAEFVIGIGTSHGPQLKVEPERWDERGRFDRASTTLVYRGAEYDFAALSSVRPSFAEQNGAAARRQAYRACQRALDRLGELVAAARPDVLLIVSSDHKEIYGDELLAPFAVYWGEEVAHLPFTDADLAAMAPGLAASAVYDVPAEPITRRCHPELALHLIETLAAEGFDVAAARQLPPGRYRNHGIPHGWGYVYQRILGERADTPFVPIFVNTFFPPNPPSARRCHDLGRALGRAVDAAGDLRVGIVASGGLSHFVIEEDLDRRFLRALAEEDADYLRSLEAARLRSGTSELRSWIAVSAALAGRGLRPELVDYQPCYRTEAGTGNAMGFFAWTRG